MLIPMSDIHDRLGIHLRQDDDEVGPHEEWVTPPPSDEAFDIDQFLAEDKAFNARHGIRESAPQKEYIPLGPPSLETRPMLTYIDKLPGGTPLSVWKKMVPLDEYLVIEQWHKLLFGADSVPPDTNE